MSREFENIIDSVEARIQGPMVTARFGDGWRNQAAKTYSKETAIEIAFINGRRAILLEYELERALERRKPFHIKVKEIFKKLFYKE